MNRDVKRLVVGITDRIGLFSDLAFGLMIKSCLVDAVPCPNTDASAIDLIEARQYASRSPLEVEELAELQELRARVGRAEVGHSGFLHQRGRRLRGSRPLRR